MQTIIKGSFNRLFIQMLADKDEFLHSVTVLRIPVFAQLGIVCHELHEFLFGHGSKPFSGLADIELTTCLLEEIAHVVLFGKIAHAFATDHVLRPMLGNELIKHAEIEGFALKIDVSLDTELGEVVMITMLMIVVMVMVMMLIMFVMLIVIVIIIIVLIVIVVMMSVFDFLNRRSQKDRC